MNPDEQFKSIEYIGQAEKFTSTGRFYVHKHRTFKTNDYAMLVVRRYTPNTVPAYSRDFGEASVIDEFLMWNFRNKMSLHSSCHPGFISIEWISRIYTKMTEDQQLQNDMYANLHQVLDEKQYVEEVVFFGVSDTFSNF